MKISNEKVKAIRQFNRVITQKMGALQASLYHSNFSLPEARLIYELYHLEETTSTSLGRSLDLDLGYLSRLLKKLEQDRIVQKRPSKEDSQKKLLSLTSKGLDVARKLDNKSTEEVKEMLSQLNEQEQSQLVEAMQIIEQLFGEYKYSKPYILRNHKIGDMGLITYLHGKYVATEFGWGEKFEALVGKITSDFQQNYNPDRERCIIAEKDGELIGCIFLVDDGEDIAKLRLLYVSPSARGLGLGQRLVEEVIDSAKKFQYKKITLWTNDILKPARHIYKKCGFKMVDSEPHEDFGEGLIGETWEFSL